MWLLSVYVKAYSRSSDASKAMLIYQKLKYLQKYQWINSINMYASPQMTFNPIVFKENIVWQIMYNRKYFIGVFVYLNVFYCVGTPINI